MLPYYQPLIRLGTGEIMALEALARMRMPDGTIVTAGAFQEALLEHRIAYSLTGQMLSQVAADARRWLDAGLPLQRIGLNVTTADFQAGDLRRRVQDAFARVDVPLKHLVIEVTEMVFMNGNEAAAVRDLQALREAGSFVALDDFGTGYASLTQLRTLPVDVIKIDKSFVNSMLVETTSGSIVEGLVDLALKLGLNVVAEGVETVEQAERPARARLPFRPGLPVRPTRRCRDRRQPDGPLCRAHRRLPRDAPGHAATNRLTRGTAAGSH